MKRIKRNPEKFEVIDLFTALGSEHGYKLSVEEDASDFIKRIGNALKVSKDNPNLLYGKRVESLFAHVAGALGECRLIKQEDSGEAFTAEEDIQAPDYKVILNDGSKYFIEVKNCHLRSMETPYPFKKDYLRRVERYADLHNIPLLFAIYFSQMNMWVLLRKESLIEESERYTTKFENAVTRNEMPLLGDRLIATEPDLSIELLADRSKRTEINENGIVNFSISCVKIYSSDREVTDDIERSIAFYLIRFGEWIESEAVGIFDGNEFIGARFSYRPELPPEEHNFSSIGYLSSMVSSFYAEKTINAKNVVALDTNLDPEVFAVEIPDGYKGEGFPLWQFIIKPNSK